MIYLKEKEKKKHLLLAPTISFYLFCSLFCIWTSISLIIKIMLLVLVPALFGCHLPSFLLHPDIPCEEKYCCDAQILHFFLYCKHLGISVIIDHRKENGIILSVVIHKRKHTRSAMFFFFLESWPQRRFMHSTELWVKWKNISETVWCNVLFVKCISCMTPVFPVCDVTSWFSSSSMFLPATQSSWHHLCLCLMKKTE